jgi:hypothetical protein
MTATTLDIQERKLPGYNELAKGFGMLKLSNAVAGSFQGSACTNRRVISMNRNLFTTLPSDQLNSHALPSCIYYTAHI